MAENHFLLRLLATYYGKHVVLIGVPQQQALLKASVMPYQVLLTPLPTKNTTLRSVECEYNELPIAAGSVDLVLVPHTLEHIENPRQLLSEACRIVKPEGHIIIMGFNPMSLWGFKKFLTRSKAAPWSGTFFPTSTVKKWLGLADFELVKQEHILFRPPVKRHGLFRKLKFLEWLGRKCYRPFGGVYVLVAKAKTISLTPIRLRWQQKLSSVRVTTIPGPTMRDFFK